MPELLVDFITSLDGYASAEGWPGWWGLEGPEYLAWLGEQPEVTYLMGANTYRLMSGFADGKIPEGTDEFTADEEASVDGLTQASKVVFSASLEEPLKWANTTLVRDEAVEVVRAMKEDGSGLLSTIGSISLCRSLVQAGLVDRFRVVMFPVITGATGAERIYIATRRRPRDDRQSHLHGRIREWSVRSSVSSTHRPQRMNRGQPAVAQSAALVSGSIRAARWSPRRRRVKGQRHVSSRTSTARCRHPPSAPEAAISRLVGPSWAGARQVGTNVRAAERNRARVQRPRPLRAVVPGPDEIVRRSIAHVRLEGRAVRRDDHDTNDTRRGFQWPPASRAYVVLSAAMFTAIIVVHRA
jgi:dihydrofolate reductase